MNCVECKLACCNNNVHEMRNAEVSLSYVHKCFERGEISEKMIKRMKFELDRISKALKGCRGLGKRPK